MNGKVEPSDAECKRSAEEVEADEEHSSHIHEIVDEKAATDKPVSGIPEFWATCLKNSPIIEQLIMECDEPVLAHLVDIRVSFLSVNQVI